MHRRPVGYQREFLQSYQPGTTFYLPEPLRRQLHEMGRTSAHERPAGTYARDILGRLLVDLSWASSKLEGNTYSRLDTQNLIEFGQAAKGKDALETQMILNHKSAIEMLIENADEVRFDAFTFKNLHAVLSQDLMRDPQASGRLRRRPVDISGTVFHPLALPQVIEDCFALLLEKAAAIPDPFEQAFFLMVQLPYLQPFEDVNKRVSRIGANIPLFTHNLCPLSFIDVPEHAYIEGTLGVYELNQIELLRDVFVWAYERSCQRYLAIAQTMVEPDPLKIKYREALIRRFKQSSRGCCNPARPPLLSWPKRTLPRPTKRPSKNCSPRRCSNCTKAALPATGCVVRNTSRGSTRKPGNRGQGNTQAGCRCKNTRAFLGESSTRSPSLRPSARSRSAGICASISGSCPSGASASSGSSSSRAIGPTTIRRCNSAAIPTAPARQRSTSRSCGRT